MEGDIGGYFTKPSRIGSSHSYTVQETTSASEINKFVSLAQISGKELVDYTREDWYYCIAEDGSVFKFHPEERLFYQLDLKQMQWEYNQSWASIIHDTNLRFQEFDGFRDYFPHAESRPVSSSNSIDNRDQSAPEVVFTFREDLKPGEMEELLAKRDALLRDMGYLPPDELHEYWWDPKEGSHVPKKRTKGLIGLLKRYWGK